MSNVHQYVTKTPKQPKFNNSTLQTSSPPPQSPSPPHHHTITTILTTIFKVFISWFGNFQVFQLLNLLPYKHHASVEEAHDNTEGGEGKLPDTAGGDDCFWIRISSPVLQTNIEEVGDHEASNDDFIEENIDEQNIDKVQFSTQHDEF